MCRRNLSVLRLYFIYTLCVYLSFFRFVTACYTALYLDVLHFVDADVILNFRLSHGDDTTVFKNMLAKFLSHVVSHKRKKTEDSSFSVHVKAQRNKMLTALRKGENVCNIDDIKKYFSVKFIIKAFEEYQNRIIWDIETKTTMPAKEEYHLPLTTTDGNVAPQPSHSSDEADQPHFIAREPIQRTPTSSNMDDEPFTADGATQYQSPLPSTPTVGDADKATHQHTACKTSPQQSPSAKPQLKQKSSADQGALTVV